MSSQLLLLLALLAASEAARPCRVKKATTPTTPTVTTSATSTTTVPAATTTVDPKAPCMAQWANMKPDDSDYLDYSSASKSAASAAECGQTCLSDAQCAYAYFDTLSNCVTFEKFQVLDFDQNAKGSMLFKLYLNGTGTCSTVSLPKMASSKLKMYYPDGGSYWLADGLMDLISYACYNPALGYKRRKRSVFEWLLNY